ncbi:Rieske (2Fe-2S) domain protein [Pirellula staleyi DSM 6068]|uniref:Rieske (2Fe-2S) domain protein n=1 Tax=Pirellula staleyi (strain ATCC 27377 / DSM 6068 / ICPB 4128) TaxID=530564 RepID=D2R118_PIRSD|nr:Rieske 2Fe-2S domain-containing protein [Pirellula staleyi]ADB18503.1 Rieske (2Fe-2S) domain protein [Pirellula staleyi DSM 6068]
MAKSLNPHASGKPKADEPTAQGHGGEPPRRNLLVATLAAAIGGFVGLFPVGAGMALFLNPLLKKKAAAGEGDDKLKRVATIESLPADGTPIQVPVIADKIDAWTGEPNQPVGAVFLRRTSDNKVECLNAICPHAGCMVSYSADRKLFQCPCHTSSFELDGKRILPSPSPRDMDGLVVDETKLASGEVWIDFVNYYPGKEHQEPKA